MEGSQNEKAFTTAAREKRWSEMGLEEKIERVREVLRVVEGDLQDFANTASAAHSLSLEHQHDSLGRVLRLAGETINRPMGFEPRRGRRHSRLD